MFVAKLFVVLLIVSASVCSKHKRQSPVEVEHHGQNEACPRLYLNRRCPDDNFPSLHRLNRARSFEEWGLLIRQTPLEDFCRDIPALLTCVKEMVLSVPERCLDPRLINEMLPAVNAGLTASNYICTEEIENIKTYMLCYTNGYILRKVQRCVAEAIWSRQCNEDKVIKCISRAIDDTGSCQEGAKEVFERIANRLADDIQPCALFAGPNRSAIFKFFK